MPIIVGAIVVWIAVTFFSLIPKKLSSFETIFVFCTSTIFELSVFSILHINLRLIEVEPGIANGMADLMFRLLEIPLLLTASANLLLYRTKIKWVAAASIVLFTLIVQQTSLRVGILHFHHWNLVYSGLGMCANVGFASLMAWVITSINGKVPASS